MSQSNITLRFLKLPLPVHPVKKWNNAVVFQEMQFLIFVAVPKKNKYFSRWNTWGGPVACLINPTQRFLLIQQAFISGGDLGWREVDLEWNSGHVRNVNLPLSDFSRDVSRCTQP